MTLADFSRDFDWHEKEKTLEELDGTYGIGIFYHCLALGSLRFLKVKNKTCLIPEEPRVLVLVKDIFIISCVFFFSSPVL